MKNHYFISARTQFDNLGDALINEVLFNTCRSKGILHIDCKGVPNNYKEVTGINNDYHYTSGFAFFKKLLILRLSGNSVTYLLKPGHIFTLSDSFKQFIQDCITILIFGFLKLIGVKIKRFGASLAPFSPVSCFMEKIKTRLSDTITYREEYSGDFIRKNNFKNVSFCPDLLFYPDYQKLKLLDKPVIKIAFSFRSSAIKNGDDREYMAKIKEFIKNLSNDQAYELIAVSQVSRDEEFQKELIALTDKNISHYLYDCSVAGRKNVIEGYKNADVIVSNRLHGLLNGAIYGCHPIAFVTEENHKVTGVLKTANLGHLVLSAKDSTLDDFKKLLSRSYEDEYKGIDNMRVRLKNILNSEL